MGRPKARQSPVGPLQSRLLDAVITSVACVLKIDPRVCLSISGIQAIALLDPFILILMYLYIIIYFNLYWYVFCPSICIINEHCCYTCILLKLAGFPAEIPVCESLGSNLLIGSSLCRSAIIDFQNKLLTKWDQKFPKSRTDAYLNVVFASGA